MLSQEIVITRLMNWQKSELVRVSGDRLKGRTGDDDWRRLEVPSSSVGSLIQKAYSSRIRLGIRARKAKVERTAASR